jgi:hypothetical protein
MSDQDDVFEVEELLRVAEWRMRKVDEDPGDEKSAAVAKHLEMLAEDVRRLRDSTLFREYVAICNWLGESDGIEDFSRLADGYRRGIGFDRSAESGEAYQRGLIELAKQASGTA